MCKKSALITQRSTARLSFIRAQENVCVFLSMQAVNQRVLANASFFDEDAWRNHFLVFGSPLPMWSPRVSILFRPEVIDSCIHSLWTHRLLIFLLLRVFFPLKTSSMLLHVDLVLIVYSIVCIIISVHHVRCCRNRSAHASIVTPIARSRVRVSLLSPLILFLIRWPCAQVNEHCTQVSFRMMRPTV